MNPSNSPRTFLSISLALSLVLVGTASQALLAADAGMLVAPEKLYAGGKSAVTVTSFDSVTREPVARPLVVELVSPDGTSVATLYTGATGAAGHRRIEFNVPFVPNGTYKIRARITGIEAPLEAETVVARTPGILIETDKPIYKPSQTIQGRVVLIDNGLRPMAGDVEVTFHDAKGIRIDRKRLTANEYGVASFSLDLAQEVNFGTWKIRAKSEGGESVRDLKVEEYTLPRYDLKLEFPKSWALVDEAVQGDLTARYFFGKDVQGTATIVAKRYVATWEEYATVTGSLEAGKLSFTLPPVGFVSGTAGASGQGTVTLDVSVTDSTGQTQSMTDVLTIVEAPVVLSLVARSGTLKPDLAAEVLVGTKSPDGAPLSMDVSTTTAFYSWDGSQIGTLNETVTTTEGVGTLRFTPPADTSYAQVHASAELSGHGTSFTLAVGGAYSPSGSFLSLARSGGDGAANVGQVLFFSALSTHPGTVYYEVYAGGRTVLSDAVESDIFSFSVTVDMLPRAKVVAYKINPDNEVAADSLAFDVNLPVTVSLSADFSAETVKPGDPVQVIIDAGTGKRTLLGVSVVDESVLALGRSRLHMADVFAELEARFLEPEVEVHEGEEPGGIAEPGPMVDVGFGGRFVDPSRTRGALDTLNEAGLTIAVSAGITVPQGGELGWLGGDWAEDGNWPPVPAAGGASGPSEPPIRVRQYFPETWVWEPLLLTDETGRVTMDLTAPDSITGWKMSIVGTTENHPVLQGGTIVFGEDQLTVFQDFFVDPSLPYSVVRGEVFPVKLDIFNYLETGQTVSLSLAESDGFEIIGEKDTTVEVGAGSASAVHFPIRPTGLGDFPIQVTARGSSFSDAVLRQITVVPEGRPVEEVSNGVIEAGSRIPLDVFVPPEAVSGSARAYLNISPSPVAQTMNGVSDLLGMPYGCGEQNMIFLAPDIEILKYLRETGELSPEVRAKAEYYVNVGYQRELTYMSDDKGFAAFGGPEGSLWLTAFVLSTFSSAREVRDIDESVLAGAAEMLASRQNEDGSFRTDDLLIHQEMDGGLSNVYGMAAYVTNALADYVVLIPDGTEPPAQVVTALSKAAAFLQSARTALPGINDDPYPLSIAAVALQKVPGYADASEAIIDRLLQLADGDGIGIHWEPYPVETTGYAAMALLGSNGGAGRPEASGAIEWLSAQRNALGGYGESTQDTVVAIRALFLAARKVHLDLDVVLSVMQGTETLFLLRIDASNYDLFHQFELPLPTEGTLTPELVSEGTGNVCYQVVTRFNVPGDLLPPPRDMLMDVVYDSSHIEVDDKVDVRVSLKYTGFKAKTGMVIADVGVPTGFAAVKETLDALVEAKTVSRVEQAGRKVIFYIDSLEQNVALAFTFQVLALYPVRAEGVIAHVYEYYDPDVEAFDRQGSLVIEEKPSTPRPFIRGDSNDDALLDLSDAVVTLGYLFLGQWSGAKPICLDAADANDDGGVDISDPIGLLQHLFVGGKAPPAPFPDAGLDPTEDGLGC